ncbi:MAG: hypothetical protein AB7I27_03720 [Bacteriovoracaceae bacterium]
MKVALIFILLSLATHTFAKVEVLEKNISCEVSSAKGLKAKSLEIEPISQHRIEVKFTFQDDRVGDLQMDQMVSSKRGELLYGVYNLRLNISNNLSKVTIEGTDYRRTQIKIQASNCR